MSRRAENRDIREWAAAEGHILSERGPIPADVRAAWETREVVPDDELRVAVEAVARGESSPLLSSATEPGTDSGATPAVESAPVPPPKRTRLRAIVSPSREPRRRESLSGVAQFAWGGLANVTARSGRVPLSRMLTLQAPVAGELLDDSIRGTLLDRLLQPLARSGKRGETLFALIGPLVLVEMLQRHPERQDQLLPMLAYALESYCDLAGPKVAAAQKRAQKRAEQVGAQGIQEMIQWLFAPDDSTAGGVPGDRAAQVA